MTKYIDAEKLNAEIERRIAAYQKNFDKADNKIARLSTDGRIASLKSLLSFIDSLQEEQPIDKNILTWRDVNELERIINKVHYEFPHGIGEEAFGKLVLERFIDGKDDVQEFPATKKCSSLPSNLDKAARKYAKTTFKKPHSDNPDEEVTIVEPDKYAGFIAGAKWDKEQMMSNAVEGTVYGNGVYTWVAGDIPSQFKYGDKVRVIVLPKED